MRPTLRYTSIGAALVLMVALTSPLAKSRVRPPNAQPWVFHHENVLGTSLELKLATASEEQADRAEAAALREIDRLSKVLSAWDSSSEFSRWSRTRGETVAVSPELFEVLGLFDRWQRETGGAINAAAAAGNAVWKSAAREGRVPTDEELNAVAVRMQAEHWVLDSALGTATHRDDVPLALASFTKSYIAGKAAGAALDESGVYGAVVNIGGDIVVRGEVAAETVAIRNPLADAENDAPMGTVVLRDGSIATSGSYRRGVEAGGRHYSHVVDPRTGRTAEDVLSSTVRASDPVTAGALATAFSVLPVEESRRIAARLPGVEYAIARRDGSIAVSDGWRQVAFSMASQASTAAAAAAGDWNSGLELIVNLALARVEDPRYRRPYVAVWIEDKDKFPVRTIALWYEKPRWLPDLKVWYRDDRLRALAEGTDIAQTVSSATRPPGKYTLKWDGKDNKGKPVKAGKYTVCIEVSREHGTYQISRQDMDFTGVPKQVQIPGNTEMESASLDYRKVAH